MKHINVRRRVDLTPRKGRIYDALKEAKKKNSLLNYRYSAFKTRLQVAEKYMNDHRECLSKLNNVTTTFIESQIRSQSKKPQGRRFTLDDKIFALSLFKQSGKAYRLLQKVFALPCKSTLMSLLQKIPFEAGINKKIFQHLKKTVNKIKNPLDKYCTVIFDEISLSAGLQYVPHQDRVIGFEDLGNNKTKSLFADKALTFMVRGIRRKFKQPVAFVFTNSSMKTPDLLVAIKEVIRAVQSTGLMVAALICDQASTNVAAINKLKMETKEMYSRLGKDKKPFGFEIGNQEIVPLFDPPHLLKCMRNNLITKNLIFSDRGIQHVAKWEHLTQLYELDKTESNIGDRINPKLTDAHIYVDKMKKMKVLHAAQVFSQRVGSIMKLLATWSGKLIFLINSIYL